MKLSIAIARPAICIYKLNHLQRGLCSVVVEYRTQDLETPVSNLRRVHFFLSWCTIPCIRCNNVYGIAHCLRLVKLSGSRT